MNKGTWRDEVEEDVRCAYAEAMGVKAYTVETHKKKKGNILTTAFRRVSDILRRAKLVKKGV